MTKFKKKIICPVCGIEFQADRPCQDRVTCSRKCANIHKSQIVYKCTCANCGKSFDGNSPNEGRCNECRKAICLTCGKVFTKTKPSSQYCSQECVALDKDLRARIGIKGSQTKVEKIAAGTFSIQKPEAKSHKCVNCGKIFLSHGPCPKYCNDCTTFTCVVCREKFTAQFGTNPKTCSIKCRGLSQKKKTELVCENCRRTFIGDNKRRFCSKDCAHVSRIRQNQGQYSEVTCAVCGKNDLLPKRRAEIFVVCSRHCESIWQSIRQYKPSIICTCVVCDKKFEVRGESIARKRKVCSRKCLCEFRSRERIGENNTFYGKHHSRETKEIISLKAADRIANGLSNFDRGKCVSKISGETELHDSSWELKRFQQLDELGITWTKKHGIRITYRFGENFKHFVPDILIQSNPTRVEEIKPKGLVERDEQTQAKLAAGKRWCDKRGYDFVVLTEDDLFGNNKSQ